MIESIEHEMNSLDDLESARRLVKLQRMTSEVNYKMCLNGVS
jgi:hypothetical protein